jgi:hypothetical protein
MRMRAMTAVLGLAGVWIGAPLAMGQEDRPARRPARPSVQAPQEAGPTEGTPRMELSSAEWDFGTKWYGEPCATEITIANTGDAPLRILNVRSSCGCTVARPKKRELLPGESDTMSLTYNTKRAKRKVSQTITLETNDPQQRQVAIRVTGEVKHLFEATPANRITFGKIERDEVATETVELRNNRAEKVFLKLKPDDKPLPFDVKLEEVEPGVFYKLSATTKPPLKLGSNSAKILLETGLKEFPAIEIAASVYIAPRVAVTPPRLSVTSRVTKRFQRLVSVTYSGDKPVAIKEIRSSHPDLVTAELLPQKTARPDSARRFHRLRVWLPPYNEMPEEGARLEIFTDDPSPEYQKLVVEVEKKRTPPRAVRPRPKPMAESGEKKPAKPKGGENGGARAPQ